MLSETYAAWVAAHVIFLFYFVPTVVAGGVVALWCFKAGRPPRQSDFIQWGLIGLAVLVFALLAAALRQQGAVVQFDTALARALRTSVPAGWSWLPSFTRLGEARLLALFAVCWALVLCYRRYWMLAVGWAAAIAGGNLLNVVLKQIFQRVRPEQIQAYVTFPGWSFPSGHASAAMAAYGMLSYLALRLLPAPWREVCLFGAAWLITAISLSRVLLQAHYLSDVLAGCAVTFVWLGLCIAVTEKGLRRGAVS